MVRLDDTETAFVCKSDRDLDQAYWIYRAMGFTWLSRVAFFAVRTALRIHLPIIPVIRATIFRLFCGGESIAMCDSRIQSLAGYGVKTILDYSVEARESDEHFDLTMQEVLATIVRAAGDDNIPFAVFKPTGIARFSLLAKVSSGQPLTSLENAEYRRVRSRFEQICTAALNARVRVLVDAEESWIQGALDDLVETGMAQTNRSDPIVYHTLQMYRTDRLDYLVAAHTRALKGGYKLGVKLVRGAYLEKERCRATELGLVSPIQAAKEHTDRDFNRALAYCIEHLDSVAS